MRHVPSRFEGVSTSPLGEPVARISCAPKDLPKPGQAFLSHHSRQDSALRKLMFPIQLNPEGFISDIPPGPAWNYGDALDLWGPLGDGFTPPQGVMKWLLVSLGQPPLKLLPLVDVALRDGAAVALYTDDRVPEIPPQVELNPDIHEAILWADYVAIDLSIESRHDYKSEDPRTKLPHSELRRILAFSHKLGITKADVLSATCQVLISSPMPCGLGTCGACAVRGTPGWKLACVDGPVFPLADLEW